MRIHHLEFIVSILNLSQDSQLPAISLLNDSIRRELDVRDFVGQFYRDVNNHCVSCFLLFLILQADRARDRIFHGRSQTNNALE